MVIFFEVGFTAMGIIVVSLTCTADYKLNLNISNENITGLSKRKDSYY